MSDNDNPYRSGVFAAELQRVRASQILTPPYTPRWNGKVERFFQTLKREWADAHTWPSSTHRTRALPSFIRYYNRHRPSQLPGRPATHQPRSQPPGAGHLVGNSPLRKLDTKSLRTYRSVCCFLPSEGQAPHVARRAYEPARAWLREEGMMINTP